MIRRDEYLERFREITTERDWTEEQQMYVGRMAVAGFGSTEQLVRLAEAFFAIEDGIEERRIEKMRSDYDRVFGGECTPQNVYSTEEFKQTPQYQDPETWRVDL